MNAPVNVGFLVLLGLIDSGAVAKLPCLEVVLSVPDEVGKLLSVSIVALSLSLSFSLSSLCLPVTLANSDLLVDALLAGDFVENVSRLCVLPILGVGLGGRLGFKVEAEDIED